MSGPGPMMSSLRELRREREITQESLARRAGFSASEISKWERGARDIKLWQYEVLVEALGARVVVR